METQRQHDIRRYTWTPRHSFAPGDSIAAIDSIAWDLPQHALGTAHQQ